MAADRPLPRYDTLCDDISGDSGLDVRRLVAVDFWDLEPPDDPSARDYDALTEDDWEALAAEPYAFSYRKHNTLLGITVVKNHSHGRVGAACLLSRYVKPDMLRVVNAIRRMLDAVPYPEVWSTVDYDYEAGHRLVKVLGYRRVVALTRHSPSGRDYVLYSRTQNVIR